MKLTQDQLDAFYHDGYIMVEDLFDPDAMAAALRDMEHIFYGKSFDEYLADLDKTGKSRFRGTDSHQCCCALRRHGAWPRAVSNRI